MYFLFKSVSGAFKRERKREEELAKLLRTFKRKERTDTFVGWLKYLKNENKQNEKN